VGPGTHTTVCKRLRSPGIDSKESIPPAYVSRRAGKITLVVVPARPGIDYFLESITGLFKLNIYKFGVWSYSCEPATLNVGWSDG
jgi:hypothetical protein